MKEVKLEEEEVEWLHQNLVGNFLGGKNDKIQGGLSVQYIVPKEKKYIGKLVFITARYHGLHDTTWIKIVEG